MRGQRLPAPTGSPDPGGSPETCGEPAHPADLYRYLDEIVARLPGPRSARDGITAELRSGLLDAMDAHRSAGLSPAEAAAAAIREFGDAAAVAGGFRAELAASQARRAALALLVTGPLVGLLWLEVAVAGHLGIRFAPPWQWSSPALAVRVGVPLVAVAVAVTACAAVLGIAAAGRLTRWLPVGPRTAPTAAAVAGFGAVGADGLGVALLAIQLAVAPERLSALLAAIAVVASLTRLLLAKRAADHFMVLRATLA